jgi:uncharacterized membrane protein
MLKPFLVVILFHILLYFVIILDIPIVRQIVVFCYLTFVPGFLILKLLKPTRTVLVEKLLFTVGLSLAFLMFVGLLINQLFFTLNILEPLSSIYLLISFSCLTLFLSLIAFCQDLNANLKRSDNFVNLKNLFPKSVLIIPLILGIVGSLYSNVYVLSLMIISIVVLFV